MPGGDPKTERTEWLSRWPILVALAVVALLIVGMVGFDVYFSETESLKTTDIIENAQRSIVLLNDIRFDAKRLAGARNGNEIERWRQRLLADGTGYDVMASYEGERAGWNRLQVLLRQLPIDAAYGEAGARKLEDAIDKLVDDLVAINAAAGQGNAKAIHAAHRQAIWGDVLAGGIVLVIMAIISVWLLRVLARQRQLVLDRVHFLDEKNAELEAFAGRAAHDLRSPMNPIRGYTDLILESPDLSGDVAAMAQRIRRAVDRMTRVVDDMLALATAGRPPAGEAAPTVVIPRILEEMGSELQGVEVVTLLKAGKVACAEGVLSQILRNLLGNALKFRAPTRPLRIVVDVHEVGDLVELAVEDNGIGMDAESAKRAFEPFYRAVSDREVPGHGLGLAIVERAVRAIGGSCTVTSVVDQSTRFVIRLPRA
jgi:signal transduction histidine kinase